MQTDRCRTRGSAMFLAVIMMAAALSLLIVVLSMSTTNAVRHEEYSGRESNLIAAQGELNVVVAEIWKPFHVNDGTVWQPNMNGSSPPEVAQLLNLKLGPTGTWNDFPPPTGQRFGDAYITQIQTLWKLSKVSTLQGFAPAVFISVKVRAQRNFDPSNPLWHDATDVPAVVMQTFLIGRESASPVLRFAALTKNISCSMCHASFNEVNNYFNNDAIAKLQDPANTNATPGQVAQLQNEYNSFPRVMIGSLNSFQVRTAPVQDQDYNQVINRFAPSESYLNGSLYSRGILEDGAHNTLTAPPPEALQGCVFGNPIPNTANPLDFMLGINIKQDSVGQELLTPLVPTGTDQANNPLKFGNLYLNYPTQLSKQTDGILPSDFPFPFQDPTPNAPVNQTRLVSTADVDKLITDRTARAADPTQAMVASNVIGKISGGFAQVVPTGSTYTNGVLPPPGDPSLQPSEVVGSSGVINGNLILIGTKDNPVNLDNQVFVKGDIIVKGYYQGQGSLWAQGNIYLPSDLQYNNRGLKDSNGNAMLDSSGKPIEDFGTNSAGKSNLGGLIAGGTVIIGDYLTASVSNSGTDAAGNVNTDSNGAPIVDANGKPVPSSNYVVNRPPDYNDPGVGSLPSMSNGREYGFPLVPTFQVADPNFAYSFKTLNSATGTYDTSTQNLFAKNFTLSQLEVFNRDEWAKSVKALPDGDPSKMLPDASGAYVRVDDPTTVDPNFIPRYYVLNKGDPVTGFVYGSQSTDPTALTNDAMLRQASNNGAEGTFWDDASKMWKGSEMSKVYNTTTIGGDPAQGNTGSVINGQPTNLVYDPTSNGTKLIDSTVAGNGQKAAVVALNPSWIPTDKMWNILLNEEWSRKSNDAVSQAVYASQNDPQSFSNRDGAPFRVDGLLYTNNAIFGIQRNRSLAPQAAGDYQDINGTQASDPTKPGSWPTPVPVLVTTSDNFAGVQVHDVWSYTSKTDNYSYIQNVDNYTRTPMVDTFSQSQTQAVFTRTKFQDQYTRTQYLDTYSRPVNTDTYTRPTVTEVWKQPDTPQRTVVWNIYTGSGYAQAFVGTVTQVSPPGTISPPTLFNNQTVTKSTIKSDNTITLTGAQTTVSYPAAGPQVLPPAGFTIKLSTTPGTETSVVGPYPNGANPGAPAGNGWGAPATVTSVQTVTTAAYYAAPNQPAAPAGPGWGAPSTATSTQTWTTGTYYIDGVPNSAAGANPPPPPVTDIGWVGPTTINLGTESSTVTGLTITAPAGYTGAPVTTSVVVTTQGVTYYSGPHTSMAGWTYVSTATSPPETTTTAPYAATTPAPAAPGNGFTPGTPPTTSTSATAVSSPYLAGSPAPAVPAGYSVTGTVQATTQLNSPLYMQGTPPPALPPFYTLVASQQGPTPVTLSLNRAPPYTMPATPPPGYHLVGSGNQSYAYPPTPVGKDAADFRRYAKEQDSSSRGRLMINGAAIAPDLGLLVTGRSGVDPKYPSNLIINYDRRIPKLIGLVGVGYLPWHMQTIGWSRVNPGATNAP